MACVSVAAGGAQTTEEQVPMPATEPAAEPLGEIVVSAQRRLQNLQDVPLAVTAISEEAIRALSADGFADLARTIPGVSFSQFGPGRQKVAIRGINANTGGATVAYYIDDTPLPATFGTVAFTQTDLRTFDVSRIEVLRGPQGTLYGARALGGAIRVIPNRPDSTAFDAALEASGDYTRGGGPGFSFNGMLNLPLAQDRLAARFVAFVRDRDGFIDRRAPIADRRVLVPGATGSFNSLSYGKENVGAERTVGGRAALEWTPNSWLSVRPSVMFQDTRLDGFQDVTGGASNPDEDLVQNFLADVEEPSRERWSLSNLSLEADLGWATLVSSTSGFRRENAFVEEATAALDQDGFFLEGGPILAHVIEEGTNDRAFIQELRLASADTEARRLAWQGGLFYSDRKTNRYIAETLPGYNEVYGPLGGPFVPNDDFYTVLAAPGMEKEKGAFAELELRLLEPLSFTAGVRHYEIENGGRAGGTTATGIYGEGELPEPIAASTQKVGEGQQYRFNLAWNVDDDRMLYAQAAQGFRPGSSRGGTQPSFVNNPLCRPQLEELGLLPFPDRIESDELWNYELGGKSRVGRGTVVNAAIFNVDWQKIPQRLFLDCGFNFTANAGAARSRGVELEVFTALTEQLSVNLSASYIDATLSEDAPQFGAQAGDRLQEVPRWQAAAAGTYRFRALDRFDGTLHLDAQYTAESNFAFDPQDPLMHKGDFLLVNARVEFSAGDDYTISVFARNLLDSIERQGLQTALAAPIDGRPRYVVNPPLTFGIGVLRRFR
jgi:iron complex outermembrane receptor protein